MTQYPNEKDPHSNWVYPQEGAPAYPPPTQDYTSRDGAPALAPGQSTSYTPPSQYQAPPPPQGYYPAPEAPPPDYGYAQSHPDTKSAYDQKGDETWIAPPSNNPYDAPLLAPDAGPSSSTSPDGNKSGIMVSLGAFFGNKGPPPMWQRQPPAPGQLPYDAFPPMCLISNGKDLPSGFPELPPPCQMNPHPFVTHDVAAEDWKRHVLFLAVMASVR
jgi:hypothetical protein